MKTIWKQPEISKAMELLYIPGDELESYFFKKKTHNTRRK